jgi:hypothetical protein
VPESDAKTSNVFIKFNIKTILRKITRIERSGIQFFLVLNLKMLLIFNLRISSHLKDILYNSLLPLEGGGLRWG